MLIDDNIYRALLRIKNKPETADLLVDPECKEDLLSLLLVDSDSDEFSLQQEFESSYKLVKDYINNMDKITSKEDLDVLKEAQKFLTFLLRNEEKLASVEEVKRFKETVLEALDAASPELRDQVIAGLAQ